MKITRTTLGGIVSVVAGGVVYLVGHLIASQMMSAPVDGGLGGIVQNLYNRVLAGRVEVGSNIITFVLVLVGVVLISDTWNRS